jgi:hypothetical protein
MSVEDYHDQTMATWISKDNETWHSDYYLMLNDETNSGDNQHCRGSCSRHTLTITSAVDQTVWVAAHTWDDRQNPGKCTSYSQHHVVSSSELTIPYSGWHYGSNAYQPK